MPGSYHLLEVVCQYNATVQATDLKGTPGLPIRPPSIPTVSSNLLGRGGDLLQRSMLTLWCLFQKPRVCNISCSMRHAP